VEDQVRWDVPRGRDVVFNKGEVGIGLQVRNVLLVSRMKIVHAGDAVPKLKELLAEVRAKEPCPSGDERVALVGHWQ
jgi:hypothetical protein